MFQTKQKVKSSSAPQLAPDESMVDVFDFAKRFSSVNPAFSFGKSRYLWQEDDVAISDEEQREIDEAWVKEAERISKLCDSGKMKTYSLEEVLRKINIHGV